MGDRIKRKSRRPKRYGDFEGQMNSIEDDQNIQRMEEIEGRDNRKRRRTTSFNEEIAQPEEEILELEEETARETSQGKEKEKSKRFNPKRKNKWDEDVRLSYNILRRSITCLATKLDKIVEDTQRSVSGSGEIEREEPGNKEPQQTLTTKESKSIVYNIRNLNLEKPKFGNSEKTHPITFLENLTTYLKKMDQGGSELELVKECLIEEAKDWARVYQERWTNFEEFKTDFLNTFWGENEQSIIRRNIVQGCWDRQKEPSMLNYFLKISSQAQMLNYKIPEKQLLQDIIRHYPKNIQQVWITSKIQNLLEMAEFLKNMDLIAKQETHQYSSAKTNNNRQFEKKRGQIRQNYQNWKRPEMGRENSKAVNNIEGIQDRIERMESSGEDVQFLN